MFSINPLSPSVAHHPLRPSEALGLGELSGCQVLAQRIQSVDYIFSSHLGLITLSESAPTHHIRASHRETACRLSNGLLAVIEL